MRVAVLVTTFNRAELTLKGLSTIAQQKLSGDIDLQVFLADADSPDGTRSLVEDHHPAVHCSTIPSDNFWNHGMIASFNASRASGPWDYYLLWNDDTLLEEHAIAHLLKEAGSLTNRYGAPVVVVGSICDAKTGAPTYGGLRRKALLNQLLPGPFHEIVVPDADNQVVDTCNANALLIPEEIISRIGFLDPIYSHVYGDTDFGYRASNAGFPVVATTRFIGSCSRNPIAGSYKDPSMSFVQRMRTILGPKGLPVRECFVYTKRHGGAIWPYLFLRPYMHAVGGGIRASLLTLIRNYKK